MCCWYTLNSYRAITRSDIVFFKQKTAYEMRISDWSSDVCSSDLPRHPGGTSWHTGGDREHGRLPLLPPGRIHYRGMDIGGRRLAPLGRLNRSFPRALTFRAERRGEIMVRSRKLYRRSNDSCSRPDRTSVG